MGHGSSVKQAVRIEKLYVMRKAHDTWKCQINGCKLCKEYYKVLLTPDSK